MSAGWTFIGLTLSFLILIKAFIDLLTLTVKRRLPITTQVPKSWKKRGVGIATEGKVLIERRSNIRVQDIFISLASGVGLFLVGYIFFRNIFFAFLFALLALFIPMVRRKSLLLKRKKIFLFQFRDAMNSISTSLRAGSSLQVALKRCENDLRREQIAQKEKPVLEELEKINHDIEFGVPIDQALRKFKDSVSLEDVEQFVDAILITRAKGGNLTQVTRNTAERISDKITIQQEIDLGTSQKKMEAKILTVFPVFIVMILMLTNPTYMQPMYDSFIGNFLLFLAAVLLVANYFIGKKVTNIDL